MMRGINHQNIFEEPEDYYQSINILDRMRTQYDDEGNPCGTNCIYYAYCLMSNYFHLLIRERDEKVGDTIKRIAGAYVYYYNHKYLRDGHLFKERFKSEPVRSALPLLQPTGRKNDLAYFTTLLRYIHQNPVKAGIVTQIKDYKYSSWCEYDGSVEPVFQICNTQTVLNHIPFNDFRIAGISNSSEFQKLDRGTQWQAFIQLKEFGASVRQLQCLTGIDRGIIQRAR